jgi:hypothetical protein
MTVDTLNFVEGTDISIQTSPNPADPEILDIEISSTFVDDDTGAGGDPTTFTQWWMPLVDSDGTCVLDSTGNLIPTLITL